MTPLETNRQRLRTYFRQYDPAIGDPEAQVVPRTTIHLRGYDFHLPTTMVKRYPSLQEGSLTSFSCVNGDENPTRGPDANVTMDSVLEKRLMQIRLRHDFEYWCYKCVKIQDKLSKQLIPFRLNYGQRLAAHAYETQRLEGRPIRVIICKARQWGGSTVTQMYMLWLQLYHYKRWHSAIVSQFKNQAINIRSMLSQVISNYPTCVPRFHLSGFENLSNTKYIVERECKIQVSSAETPDALRSFDFSMLHLSEVGLWKSTPARSADDLVQALYSTVPYVNGTFIVMESTAKGIGTFFHKNWLAAEEGDSLLQPLFVPWFALELYAKFRHENGGQTIARDEEGLPVSALDNPEKFFHSLNDYQKAQWEQGATLEGIAWYAETQRGQQYSDYVMRSEYPGTPSEAFQTKSNRYYDALQVENCRRNCHQPIFTGNLRGDAEKGEASLHHLQLTDRHSPNDELQIWIRPDDPNKASISDRFLVVTDIGGLGPRADWSVVSVFDRQSLTSPDGTLERAATWRGHIDHDLLAWKAAQIAKWYDNALLVIESNTLETKDATRITENGADHFFTVIDEIAPFYSNLYMRSCAPEVAGDPPTKRYGWHTNVRTKYLAYDQSRASLRDNEFTEHDHRCCDEMDWLEIKPNGSIGAIVGQHDDIIDTTAIALYISTREMAPPKIRLPHQHKPRNNSGGIASF